jgi:predicted dithiol-disulfide oxidoreductase (DUF899 family)
MQIRFPGESAEYRTARDRLLEREIELRRAMEAVAVARRALPPGGTVSEDYVFEAAAADGKVSRVRLSGALRAWQGFARHLQLHVPAGLRGTASGAGQR